MGVLVIRSHCEYALILESKVKFDKTNMKMSKYENSVFPYSIHFTVNLPAWKPKNTNVTLMSFLRLFTETINPERKVFSQNYMTNVVKIDEIREELSKFHFVTQSPKLELVFS